MLLIPNYSPFTVRQIRESRPEKESNQQAVTRLAQTYALAEPTIRVLMKADGDFLDAYGRLS